MINKADFPSEAEFLTALRDWYAGQVLPLTYTHANVNEEFAGLSDEQVHAHAAKHAYAVADAMLSHRAKTNGEGLMYFAVPEGLKA